MVRNLTNKTPEENKNEQKPDIELNADNQEIQSDNGEQKPTKEESKKPAEDKSKATQSKTDQQKTEQPKTESKPQSAFSDKKCFRCGQRKILKGTCQNCGEIYSNLK